MAVIKFRPRVYTNREAFIDAVRSEIFHSAMRYEDIARGAGVCHGTISKLANGYTKWPSQKTLFGVIATLKLGIRLERLRR
jgi:hypothetical protein